MQKTDSPFDVGSGSVDEIAISLSDVLVFTILLDNSRIEPPVRGHVASLKSDLLPFVEFLDFFELPFDRAFAPPLAPEPS